jgi:hypothetical protein
VVDDAGHFVVYGRGNKTREGRRISNSRKKK